MQLETSHVLMLYYMVKEQRRGIKAPVDLHGCGSVEDTDPRKRKFKILVSLLLSSQTKDEVTNSAIKLLEQRIPGGLSVEGVYGQDIEFINTCISKVGFHTRKSLYLKKIAESLLDEEIPDEMERLIKLPGIGYKMAILYLYHAHGKVVGISVDTHVHRIANRLGIVKTKSPEKTRKELQSIVPRDEWGEVNKVLVGFGQVVCQAVKPRCFECIVRSGCKSARKYEF